MTVTIDATPQDRCTGHCCHLFSLPFSPVELLAAYGRWREYMRTGIVPEAGWPKDIHLIAPMAIEVAVADPAVLDRNDSAFGLLDGETMAWKRVASQDDGQVHWYTCRNLLPNGDCGIYAIRPRLCSGYPYGKRCNYGSCTWAAARLSEDCGGDPPEMVRPQIAHDVGLWIRTPMEQALVIEAPEAWR